MDILPDGSAFFVASLPLPKDHWLYREGFNEPPMPYRMGKSNPERAVWEAMLREAGRYAVRGATMNGKEKDFDPDALIQNLIVGFLGYHTPDGLSHMDPPAGGERRPTDELASQEFVHRTLRDVARKDAADG